MKKIIQFSMLMLLLFGQTYAFSENKTVTNTSLVRQLAKKKIVSGNLALYKILIGIKSNVNRMLLELLPQGNTNQDIENSLLSAASIIGEAIKLIDQIIDDLNSQCFFANPEIEYRFVNMCNFLADVTSVKSRHIRLLSEKVKQFNEYVTIYCINRKDFLERRDLELFNKITKFNQILVLCLLREEYFDIDFFDSLTDYMVYQPWEFVCKHKVLTSIAVSAAFGVGLYYGWHWYKSKNDIYNIITNIDGLKQNSADCGYFALIQGYLVSQETNKKKIEGILSKAKNQTDLIKPLKEKVMNDRKINKQKPDRGNWLKSDELIDLADSKEFKEVLNKLGMKNNNPTNVVILEGISPEMLKSGIGVTNDFAQSVNNLKNGPQCVIVCDTPQGSGNKLNIDGAGHWWAVTIVPDEKSSYGLKAFVLDSLVGDQRNNPTLQLLLKVYEKQETPYPTMLPVHEELNRATLSLQKKELNESYKRFENTVVEAKKIDDLAQHPVTQKALTIFFKELQEVYTKDKNINIPSLAENKTFDEFVTFIDNQQKQQK